MNFGELVAEVQSYLRSFVRDQELSTHLTTNVDTAALTLRVADPSVISRGRIEIGDELIWVDKVDRAAGQATIPPYGRGMDATKAADHSAGDRVIVAPLYPRKFLKDTINQTIKQIGAQLYGVEDLTLDPSVRDFRYELPPYVRDVLTVKITSPRVGDDVIYLRDWTFDKNAPADTSRTGKALYLYDDWWWDHRSRLTVTVSRDPSPLYDDSDPWAATFLSESAEDIPVLGAAARLLATSDAYDVQTRSVEANTLAAGQNRSSASSAQSQSKYLQALFMQRLDEERMRLLNQHSNRARYVR